MQRCSQGQGQNLQGQGLVAEAICKCLCQTEGKNLQQCFTKYGRYRTTYRSSIS